MPPIINIPNTEYIRSKISTGLDPDNFEAGALAGSSVGSGSGVGVIVGSGVAVAVGVEVGVMVGVEVGVDVEVAVGVGVSMMPGPMLKGTDCAAKLLEALTCSGVSRSFRIVVSATPLDVLAVIGSSDNPSKG
jgi:hypothetical protein